MKSFDPQDQHRMEWTKAGREYWKERMIVALRDPHAQVRQHAARALEGLGDFSSIKPVKAARDEEEDANTRYYMDETMKTLKAAG